jgi:DNA-binding NarL/FixJ family response regulator
VCGECGRAADALPAYLKLRPDITLVDLRLPDGYGVDVIRQIRTVAPQARLLVITTYEGDEDIHQALQAGASGYLVKGTSHETIFRALKRVSDGHTFLPPPVTDTLRNRSQDLTARERQVLSLIVAGKKNREIGDILNIKEVSVKAHVTLIFEKLQVTDRTQAAITALKRGLAHL